MIPILTTLSTIQCPHGGTVALSTSNTLCQIDGGYALVLTDVHTVEEVDPAAQAVDILQVPALLCRQTDLVQAVARSGAIANFK